MIRFRHVLLLMTVWLSPLVTAATTPQADTQPAANGGQESAEKASRVPFLALKGDLAGDLKIFTTEYEDTFAAIGNRLSLGYLELVKANPGVDPWLPGEGTQITLPRQYVLPDVDRQGIVINLAEYRLYYFTEGGVKVFPVGVGTEDNPSPLTDAEVTMRLVAPAWYPPASIREEYARSGEYLPKMIPPGPGNPLGTHALLLSEKGYLIHGTNKKFGVGMQVSHGCFRMYNEDISGFVFEVPKGTPVRVINEPVKLGMSGGEVWLEVHRPNEKYTEADRNRLWDRVSAAVEEFRASQPDVELKRRAVELAVDQADGIPRLIGERLAQVAAKDDEVRPERQDAGAAGGEPVQLWF